MGASVIIQPEPSARDSFQGFRPRRWTVEEYHQAAEVGILRPEERLELIDGEVLEKVSPMGTPHAVALSVVTFALQDAFGSEFFFRQQSPVTLTGFSELEPDFAMVRGKHRDYLDHHPIPSEICLIVEISDSTLAFDQNTKAAAYAASGILEYWIVNLVKDQLEVYRNPSAATGYQDRRIYKAREFITPLAAPQSRIKVAELLP